MAILFLSLTHSLRAELPLRPIARDQICMQRDEAYPVRQRSFKIGKRTYSYCCNFCRNKLKTEAEVRMAVDPYSGEAIDKSMAFPAATADNKVIYFENEKNFRAYTSSSSPAAAP